MILSTHTSILAISLSTIVCAQAALPPHYQNQRDLDVMVNYIKSNRLVAIQLKQIDFTKKIVFYGDCKAYFSRKVINRAPGWVGPAAPLAFSHKKCNIDENESSYKGSSQAIED